MIITSTPLGKYWGVTRSLCGIERVQSLTLSNDIGA